MNRKLAERGLRLAVLLLATSALAFRGFLESVRHLFSSWPDFRLGFSALVAHGLALYPGVHTGPIVGDIYGPVAAIFYLPPLLAPTITGDVWLAEAWTTLTVGGLLTVVCVHRAIRNGAG